MDISKKQADKLVKGCVNNERKAQEALYRLFYADMHRVCQNYLADKELSREAFNTGFLKVFKSIGNFDSAKGDLGGWIRKIMIFTAIDLCRKELKFSSVSIDEGATDEAFIEPSVLEKLYFEDILRSIRELPLATQTVFNLSVIDGFTHKEIGEQLNISEGTSRWHLSEAKKQLRTLLEQPGNSANQPKERRIQPK
jgi:RNA polymerase sigma-70 factor (ECF subfamily)